ncbi:MAG: ribonuclease HII [Candidatus Omnitrophica bacterium]|nr:ribonuclease HII [Candidatus Omnitrophota bacterium]
MKPGLSEKLRAFDEPYQTRCSPGFLAGVDEAGRGPLAGPVVAAAVVLKRPLEDPYLNDSKQLSAVRRKSLFFKILQNGLTGIGSATSSEIDQLNIYQATRLAMRRAVLNLGLTPAFLLIDGTMSLDLPISQQAVVKGDTLSASIAAASILAKVYRDALMSGLDEIYPGYFFSRHKGYGTRVHLERLDALGPCPVHRRSFSPVEASEKKGPHEKNFFD